MNSRTTTNSPSGAKRAKSGGHGSHIVPAVLFFVLFAAAAVMLLFAAAAMLLAEWFDSEIIAAAVLGGVLLLLAWGIYMIWIRRAVENISQRLETVYSVATTAGEAFGWVREKIRFLRLLLAVVRRNW